MPAEVKRIKEAQRRARRAAERILMQCPTVGRYRWEPAGVGHCVVCVRKGERFTFGNLYHGRRTVTVNPVHRWVCRTDKRCLVHTLDAMGREGRR